MDDLADFHMILSFICVFPDIWMGLIKVQP